MQGLNQDGIKGGDASVSLAPGSGASSQTAVNLCVSLRVPQAVPMDLRIGQRFVKPGSDTALLALKQTQQLQHQLFLASLHQQQVEQFTHQHMRVNMDSPQREAEAGQQEQELRLLLNKDKSKRSSGAEHDGIGGSDITPSQSVGTADTVETCKRPGVAENSVMNAWPRGSFGNQLWFF
nr:uncharacterized protein LOC122172439 isoform X2 [Chrysemys picta bellii]